MIEAEAKVVQMVFEIYTQQGLSINAIGRLLNKRQIARTGRAAWNGPPFGVTFATPPIVEPYAVAKPNYVPGNERYTVPFCCLSAEELKSSKKAREFPLGRISGTRLKKPAGLAGPALLALGVCSHGSLPFSERLRCRSRPDAFSVPPSLRSLPLCCICTVCWETKVPHVVFARARAAVRPEGTEQSPHRRRRCHETA